MAFTQHLTRRWEGIGEMIDCRQSFEGDGELSPREVVVPPSTTDKLVNLAIDVSQLKYIYLKSDQDLTFETNDSDAPEHPVGNTIELKAGNPYIWHTGYYYTNLLTVDVTKVYLTNASGTLTATLEIRGVEDATPE
ncbi:MAG TPA: hypothetical protein VMY37_04540 [Thermoguttaceae bacterium]|nr:hypothetical protein [Thermoguttaceae bacterium]